MSQSIKPPRTSSSYSHTPNTTCYNPVGLALTDDERLNELCRDGQIHEGDAVAARFRRGASWRGDRDSVHYREIVAEREAKGKAAP